MHAEKQRQILSLFKKRRILRPRDVVAAGISGTYLNKLSTQGLLIRQGRGLYVLAEDQPSEWRSFVEIAHRVPHGVICLLSALQFHGLTTQSPFEVWLAISGKAHRPRIHYPVTRIVRFSGASLTYGIQRFSREGVSLRIYSPAKTVADCFKYRNKVGLDVAIESLRDCFRQKKSSMDEIWCAAKVCRVASVMRPYMEALT